MTTEVLTSLPRRRPLARRRLLRARPAIASLLARRPAEGVLLFVVFSIGYITVAGEMVSHQIIFADAVSRVANGYFVLFSRDPHLPAVGFVWNPLPSLLLLPVLPLRGVFPVLVRVGFAGNLESALFMAGAVVLLSGCLARLGLPRGLRLVLVTLFALHPMIITYACSGESEAMLLFFLLLTVRSLLSWLSQRQPGQLVVAGLALGLAYMSRYEAVAPALAVTALVASVTLLTGRGSWSLRFRLALNDAALVGLPFLFAFGLWAVSSRLLVKQWFPTFSSEYGNAAQVNFGKSNITQATGTDLLSALRYAAEQLTGLEPLVLPLLIAAGVVAARRRDWLAIAAPAVLGSLLAFNNLAFLVGASFGWLRFQIAVIPLAVLLSGALLRPPQHTGNTHIGPARPPSEPANQPVENSTATEGRLRRLVAVPLVLLALVAAVPVSAWTLTSHSLAREETQTMLAAVSPGLANDEDRRHLLINQTEQQVAADLDAMRLPDSTVLTDSAFAFPIVLASTHATQFIITSDTDFQPTVTDPAGHQVRYLLVPEPDKAPSDALQRAHPGLYEKGGGIATVVRTWRGTSLNGDWRLLQVGA